MKFSNKNEDLERILEKCLSSSSFDEHFLNERSIRYLITEDVSEYDVQKLNDGIDDCSKNVKILNDYLKNLKIENENSSSGKAVKSFHDSIIHALDVSQGEIAALGFSTNKKSIWNRMGFTSKEEQHLHTMITVVASLLVQTQNYLTTTTKVIKKIKMNLLKVFLKSKNKEELNKTLKDSITSKGMNYDKIHGKMKEFFYDGLMSKKQGIFQKLKDWGKSFISGDEVKKQIFGNLSFDEKTYGDLASSYADMLMNSTIYNISNVENPVIEADEEVKSSVNDVVNDPVLKNTKKSDAIPPASTKTPSKPQSQNFNPEEASAGIEISPKSDKKPDDESPAETDDSTKETDNSGNDQKIYKKLTSLRDELFPDGDEKEKNKKFKEVLKSLGLSESKYQQTINLLTGNRRINKKNKQESVTGVSDDEVFAKWQYLAGIK